MPKVINIRDVPDALHARLKARARDCGQSLSAYLLRGLTLRLKRTEEYEAALRRSAKSKNATKKKSQRRSQV
jgi:plasmid stability protein